MRLFVVLISLLILKSSCATEEVSAEAVLLKNCESTRKIVGKLAGIEANVTFLNNDGSIVVIVPVGDQTKRFTACNLPKEYQKDGLSITFSANEHEIYPNERLVGTPIEFTTLKVNVRP